MAERARGRVVATAVAVLAGGLVGLPAPASAAPTPGAATAASPGEWWWEAMGIEELHDRGTGTGVSVAVIDSPIDPDVPDLAGRVVSSSTECLDPGELTDPRPRSSTVAGPAAEHATSMAALIAGTGKGTGPGGRGVRGIAPDATIRHYAVLYPDDEAQDGIACGIDFPDGDDVDRAVGRAISEAAAEGADVINLSLRTGYSQEIEDGLLDAYRAGAVVVAATGNTRSAVEWPGIGNGVVLVNPVDEDGKPSEFAAESRYLALAAPGEDVMAGAYDASGWHSDRLGSGASIASALVSGGIAALWSAHPDATAGQVLQAVRDNVGLRPTQDGSGYRTWFRRSGRDLPEVRSANRLLGWGIFDPADAVAVDPTDLPLGNPFVREDDLVNGPSADAIAAATGAQGSASPTASATTAPSPTPTDQPRTGAAPAAEETAGSRVPLLLGVALVVLVLLGALGLVLRRRATATHRASAADPGTGPPGHPEHPSTTDRTTSTEGAEGATRRGH